MLANHGGSYRFALNDVEYRRFLDVGSSLQIEFTLRPGKYRMRTVLLDLNGGKMSSRHAAVDITPPSKDVR